MPADRSFFRKGYPAILIFFSNISAFLILFIFRSADDNRLTSWKWALTDVRIWEIILFLISGIVIAYLMSRMTFPERKPVLFLSIFSFTATVPFWQAPEVIVDASRYFTQAKHLELYGIHYFFTEWGRGIHAWTDLPLVPFIYGLIFKFLGESRIYIQIFTSLLFSMTCVITYFTGKTLWDKETGFSGGLLILGIPYIYSQTPLMLVDIPTMFFLTFSIFTFIRALEKGRAYYIALSAIAIFLAVFSKYSTWLMLSVLGVIILEYLIQSNIPKKFVLQRSIATAYVSGLLILVLIILKYDVFSEQIKFLFEYQAPGLRRWGESFVSSLFYQVHPFITLAALLSVFEAIRKKDLKFIIIVWLALLIVLLQIRRIRYIMVMFPMLALMASYGFQRIKNMQTKKFLIFSVVISSLVTALTLYLPFLKKMDTVNLKNAGSFLNSIDGSGIEVITVPVEDDIINPAVAVPLLDYFTEKKIYYDYDAGIIPSPESIKESPLRFTWEYKNPLYYHYAEAAPHDKAAIAIISNGDVKTLPDNIWKRVADYRKTKVFKAAVGLFSYSPVVTVYEPQQETGGGL